MPASTQKVLTSNSEFHRFTVALLELPASQEVHALLVMVFATLALLELGLRVASSDFRVEGMRLESANGTGVIRPAEA